MQSSAFHLKCTEIQLNILNIVSKFQHKSNKPN